MSAKTQTKSAAKAAKIASPQVKLIVPYVMDKAMHGLIVADFKAVQGEVKAGQTAIDALKALLAAIDYSNKPMVHAVLMDMFKTFGEHYPDKLAIRKTLIANAGKVVAGGTKDSHVIQGRGKQVLLDVLAKATSLRELRPALSEAKPEALKETNAGTGKKATAQVAAKAAKKIPGTPVSAIHAALDILKTVAALDVFSPGSDAELLGLIEQVCSKLATKEIALRVLKAA